ncbi:MAG: NADPH-dependent FMN reductase [Chlorobiaceae bacterium]|nr:NADPH-dependent FMN reductase [Chlorobiaceae bacterium]
MKAYIFDGSPADDPTGKRIAGLLGTQLAAKGYDTGHIVLHDKDLAPCKGCFQCWLKTPGICMIDDDNRELSRKLIGGDLAIFLTPVDFGAYSPELKRMLDHIIANISPFFTTVNGETHHRKRYDRYPDLMIIGWLEEPDPEQEVMFNHLAWRNTINFHAPRRSWGILDRTADSAALAEEVGRLVLKLEKSANHAGEELPRIGATESMTHAPRKVLLLTGSPRMAKSSSASLGGYLLDRMAHAGIETETIHIYHAMHEDSKRQAMLDAIDSADLRILSFPLYIDSIPAPVLTLMRTIRERRSGTPAHGSFAAISNCGFIESAQNEHALTSCAVFARVAGYLWMGSIAIGGGEGLVKQKSLSEQGGPLIPYKKALDRVADAFIAGKPVPEQARQQLGKPFIPAWVYRFVGSRNWKKKARQNGILEKIDDQPYRRDAS